LPVTLPEYGTADGRADFYIPTKEWGVELLRNGDGLAGFHRQRHMEQHSLYLTTLYLTAVTLALQRRIPVCVLVPQLFFPLSRFASNSDIPKFHHVVFTDDFRTVSILDNKLQPVCDGEFRLYASS
jgi:hypothetical protein